MNLATANEVATFANSLGCIVKDPNPYHDVDPLTVHYNIEIKESSTIEESC